MASVIETFDVAGNANRSGVVPMDKRVLVKPDSAERVTAAGIIIPDSHAQRQDMAQTKATIIAIGETAWSEAVHDARNFNVPFTRPEAGDRILFAKNLGVVIKGLDGEDYRLLNDEDVTCRLLED